MKGNLNEQPLVELIREISLKGLSGTLRLRRERAQAAVYFDNGDLIFAASNLRTLRFRPYVQLRTSITEQELERLGTNLSDLATASALVEKGLLTREHVDHLMAGLVNDVLRVCLLWTEGEWEYDERARFGESSKVRVDIPSLLREAAHRLPAPMALTRFRNPKEIFSRAALVPKISEFLPAESFILSRLDEPMKLADLIAVSGVPELEAYRMIYGLTLSGFTTREVWQNAFRAARKPEKEVVGDSDAFAEREKSAGEIDLENFLSRLEGAEDHYEVLDIGRKSEPDEIKDAYYAIARRYHPDRFYLKSGTSLHTKVSTAFAKATSAYETLIDEGSRKTYDATMERTRQFRKSAKVGERENLGFQGGDEGADPELNYQSGMAALKQKRYPEAINQLAAAARTAPNEARYRAYFGKALASTERTRRSAETELTAAVKLEPKNAQYRTMLAELYFDLQFHRRAKTEVDRALDLDPHLAAAHNLLRKLEKPGKTG